MLFDDLRDDMPLDYEEPAVARSFEKKSAIPAAGMKRPVAEASAETRVQMELQPEEAIPASAAPASAAMDALKFDIQEEVPSGTRIKVVGVGGGGCNAVSRMFLEGMANVEFYVVNTDRQALMSSPVPNKVLIGNRVTNGLGAGSDPNLGRESALEDTEKIIEILEGADMVFVAAGMGGGTGTGATPVVASLAKELGALTVAIVTKPFAFEGPRRKKCAEKGVEDLEHTVDTLIQVPNEKLTGLVKKGTPILESFRVADDVLKQAISGISDIMNTPGVINRDFSDIKSIMQGMGRAMMGTAIASGANAALEAARQAVQSPMLNEDEMKGARAILINITGSSQLTLDDVNAACNLIQETTGNEDAMVNYGIVLDESMGDQVKVTVIATGFSKPQPAPPQPNRVGIFTAPAITAETQSAPATYEPFPEPPPSFSAPSMQQDVPRPPEQAPVPQREPEPEPVHAMAAVAAANGSSHMDEPSKVIDDLDVPAYLRKERRWWS